MNFYLPFCPIKNKSFRLYFGSFQSGEPQFPSNDSVTYTTKVSKDGGSFSDTSNSIVIVEDTSDNIAQLSYVDLTADEMNGDVIVMTLRASGSSSNSSDAQRFIIYTTPNELSSAPTKDSSLSDKITAIFQYLFFKRDFNKSSGKETIYKSDDTTKLGEGTSTDSGNTFTKGRIS